MIATHLISTVHNYYLGIVEQNQIYMLIKRTLVKLVNPQTEVEVQTRQIIEHR
jgi:hypothetical protein